ncbi:acetoin utilization protein AcuC [Sinomonas cyclohexanicum]|uniref:Acetoin utilization protein AcuC n=2 Tax=Sinomonas cyclohexanicum TaxID=322009 RepID=A0ABM7PYS0_SINCY|nr:acetoin utilization protein AcuC [Corynebacterium cyclohexanicum]BCT77448.1 acetoin utilization protein AcuC [Corynebacterium cyclohexanicum]
MSEGAPQQAEGSASASTSAVRRIEYPTFVAWSESMLEYNFGDHHPMSPARLDLTARLCEQLGLFALPLVHLGDPPVATDDELATVHTREYIAAVRRVSENPEDPDPGRGLGTEDDPAFAGMHEASARLVGGSLAAADAVLAGTAAHAVNFGGGMHHAAADHGSGFCIYNDAAAAIQRLLDGGVSRVVYIDTDAHHGDGTERIFWDEPRVMTISLHESGLTLFPGTGFPTEVGGPGAEGTAVNVALPAGTRDAGWLRAFHAVVPQLVEAFRPEVVVSQHGCDAHHLDPLTNLKVTVDAQREVALSISSLARRFCEGRWIATGGGGYEVVQVVPRAWAHLVGVAAGHPVSLHTPTPQPWRDYVRDEYGKTAPALMGEDADLWWRSWEIGFNPNDPVDRAVMATRKEVFPLHGLDPWFD